MNWLKKIAARTLYHGTCRFHEDSIRSLGVIPQAGDFVSDAYREYTDAGVELPELIFATDKEQIGKAITAMVNCISVNLNKGFHDVTNDDILKHGMLIIFRGEAGEGRPEKSGLQYAPDKDDRAYDYLRNDYPTTEPGDYFSEDKLLPDNILTGTTLVRFLKRMGKWPWKMDDRYMRERLIRLVINKHPERSRQEVLNKINTLSSEEIKKYLKFYDPGKNYFL